MTLYLILGVGQNVGAQWATMTAKAAISHELMPMLVITGAVIVYYLIIKNVPAFIAGIAGVSGFRNYGDAAVGMAVNAGMTTANVMSRASSMSGKGIQGATEGLRVAGQAYNAYQGAKVSGMAPKNALSHAAVHFASASLESFKDMATRSNSHLSFGQKLNSHMANKVGSGSQSGQGK